MEKELNNILKLFISSFDLHGEGLTSLKKKVYIDIYPNYIQLTRKPLSMSKNAERIQHFKNIDLLTKYGTHKSVEKYLSVDGKKYQDIYNINASVFIFYKKTDDDFIFEKIKKDYPKEWWLFDFETLNDDYMLVYN